MRQYAEAHGGAQKHARTRKYPQWHAESGSIQKYAYTRIRMRKYVEAHRGNSWGILRGTQKRTTT